MKKVFCLCFIVQAAAFSFAEGAAGAAGGDPCEGYWISVDEKTGESTAGWELYSENGTLYGRMLSVKGFAPDTLAARCKKTYKGFPLSGDVSFMKLTGTPWIFALTRKKAGVWEDGKIVNPEDGKLYKCEVRYRAADGKKFKEDVLEMRGEIGLGIGRSQYWRKSDRETVSNLW